MHSDTSASPLRLSIGYTLIDITKTDVVSSASSMERNQHRNWETLVQVLGLRTQIMLLHTSGPRKLDITKMGFGEDFVGEHLVWIFKFGVEQEAVFSNSNSSHGTLEGDCSSVPVILGLTETARIITPTFCASGTQKNIYFENLEF
jgi:hypothetical protein